MSATTPKKIKNLHISTVAEDARETALRYGLGLEIAEFCTAMNMDDAFAQWDTKVRTEIDGVARIMFHAPFNELCPAAIDPLVLDVARRRYRQAFQLAPQYGARRIVVHSGYVPLVYFKSYFHERSVEFWRERLAELPRDITLLLENVMEDSPELLAGIVREINDPRFRLCFDIGHANTIISNTPMDEWIDTCAPHIGHVHIHNNYREWDDHNPPGDGIIDMRHVLTRLTSEIPDDATYSIESIASAPAAEWLAIEGFIDSPR
ncbi:MAG: sugar phosphate isomerase/epimerase [Oscillospiraceae bacterium]|jgi:sugar phosphate isomerase/epimerase|nr:sugar phosphate isomerase/epimerase [Oscillospiraceae bacterium]